MRIVPFILGISIYRTHLRDVRYVCARGTQYIHVVVRMYPWATSEVYTILLFSDTQYTYFISILKNCRFQQCVPCIAPANYCSPDFAALFACAACLADNKNASISNDLVPGLCGLPASTFFRSANPFQNGCQQNISVPYAHSYRSLYGTWSKRCGCSMPQHARSCRPFQFVCVHARVALAFSTRYLADHLTVLSHKTGAAKASSRLHI
jgi:hypothetical protein